MQKIVPTRAGWLAGSQSPFPTERLLVGVVEHGARNPHALFFVPNRQRLLRQGRVVGDHPSQAHSPRVLLMMIRRSVRQRVFRHCCRLHVSTSRGCFSGAGDGDVLRRLLRLLFRHGVQRLFREQHVAFLRGEPRARGLLLLLLLLFLLLSVGGRALADHLQAQLRTIATKERVLESSRVGSAGCLAKSPEKTKQQRRRSSEKTVQRFAAIAVCIPHYRLTID